MEQPTDMTDLNFEMASNAAASLYKDDSQHIEEALSALQSN